MGDAKDKEQARLRAAVVFAVRSGQITAEEGARRLGVSRKTYYEWEQRALAAMTGALESKLPEAANPELRRRMEEIMTSKQALCCRSSRSPICCMPGSL
jgi:transposase